MPTGRYTDIIGRLRPNAIEPGDIVDLDGHVIGRHQGIVHFTVGQRRGLGIASSAPLYVVRLDAASRRVVVGPREALRMDRIVLRDVNWIGDGALDRAVGDGLEIFVRVRSTRAPQPAWLRAADGGYEVELVAGEEGVSPGQACVFYDAPSGQARVLGGGFIKSATAKAVRAARDGAAGRSRRRWSRRCADKNFQGGGMAADIDRAGVAKAYGRWAPVYDLVFGKVFDHGRQSTIAEADRIGGRILDVGVGTGLSLSDYSRDHAIVRRRYFRADAAQGAAARARAAARQCRDAGGDGRQESGIRGFVFRRGGGAICHHRGAGSRSDAGRFHPRAEARRRT